MPREYEPDGARDYFLNMKRWNITPLFEFSLGLFLRNDTRFLKLVIDFYLSFWVGRYLLERKGDVSRFTRPTG
jgi:hypothetical protein